MKITSDWHIHSRNSCDGASMVVDDLVCEAKPKGILDFGLTDHIHTPYNLPDLARSRAEFDRACPGPRFHFGVELSSVSQWEVDEIARGTYDSPVYGLRSGGQAGCALAVGITADDVAKYQLEYAVGGTHWPMYISLTRESVIRDYHRQNMFLACHDLVDIVAHPWWWFKHWRSADGRYLNEPWFDDFGHIPGSMHEEFASAVVENGKKVEINLCAMLFNPWYSDGFKRQYLDYLAGLKERGVTLSIGSDCHGEHYEVDFEAAGDMLKSVGIGEQDLWVLEPRAGSGDGEFQPDGGRRHSIARLDRDMFVVAGDDEWPLQVAMNHCDERRTRGR